MNELNVVLTGSDEGIGVYVLEELVQNPQVKTVTCLDTSISPDQHSASPDQERSTSSTELDKVQYLLIDLSKPDLALPSSIYKTLSTTTTLIIHTSWPTTPGAPFDTFQPALLGLKHLIDFAAKCPPGVTFCLYSSSAVAGRWGTLSGASNKVPEVALEDWRIANPGLGQSLLVAERLVHEATRAEMIRGVVVRVGGLMPPKRKNVLDGKGNITWFPGMIGASMKMKALPGNLGALEDLDWVPVDICADVLMQVLLEPAANGKEKSRRTRAGTQGARKTQFYHITSTHTTPFSTLVRGVRDAISSDITIIPLPAWVEKLEQSVKEAAAASVGGETPPVAKLLPLFKDLGMRARVLPNARAPRLETKLTASKSEVLRSLPATRHEDMMMWLRQWGLLDDR
jgi:nucleoside-diphosphate-sugar epimerase